ncbi:MAG: hypothetical protein ACOYOZ_15100 [Pirellula sp.]
MVLNLGVDPSGVITALKPYLPASLGHHRQWFDAANELLGKTYLKGWEVG